VANEDEENSLEEIANILNRRGHAHMFARGGPITKGMVEIGVAEEWATSMRGEFGVGISGIRQSPSDPPDCYVTISAKTISVEITELVNDDVLKQISQGKTDSSLFQQQQWNLESFSEAINKRLNEKPKNYQKNNIAIDVIIIHIDENYLSPFDISLWLAELQFAPRDSILNAYLLRTYTPNFRDWWPIFKLYGTLT
jgi:hypothetical protein